MSNDSFVRMEFDDCESELVPEGEYALRIVKFKDTRSKKGNPMTIVLIRVEDGSIENPELIRHYLTYPDNTIPAEQQRLRRTDIKRFLVCFGVPHDDAGESAGFDKQDLIGATRRCMVIQENGDDGNIYNRLKLPPLKRKGT